MEDGPEHAEGSYEYNGRVYRLAETVSERWSVYDGGRHLGDVVAVPGTQESGPEYTIDLAGESVDEPATDDWQRALETLIDMAGE